MGRVKALPDFLGIHPPENTAPKKHLEGHQDFQDVHNSIALNMAWIKGLGGGLKIK